MSNDVRRTDDAMVLVEALKDMFVGCTPEQIYQVTANVVGAVVVEVAGNDRQAAVDNSLAFGNILGRVIETTMVQLEDAENGIEEATIIPRGDAGSEGGSEAEEDDEEDA